MAQAFRAFSGPYIFDIPGDLGTPYACYKNTDGTRTGLVRLTPIWTARQLEYLRSHKPNTLFGGERGSGKTAVAIWDNLFTAYRVPGCVQMIIRRTMGELRRTIIDLFLKLPENLRGRFTDSAVSPRLMLDNGSQIHFASCNELASARKYQGGEFLKVTIDEWSQLPFTWWSYIAGSVRPGTFTHDIKGRPIVAQLKGLTNPNGCGADVLRHLFGTDIPKPAPDDKYIKNLDIIYDPDDYLFVKSVMSDNPAYNEDTPAGKAYRKMLGMQVKAIREAWLYGLWSGFEGMFFDCFDKEATVIPHDRLLSMMAKQYWMPIGLGSDIGVQHHAYTCWNTVLELPLMDGTKQLFIVTFDELLVKGRSERALAGEILDQMGDNDRLKKRINKIYLSPEAFGEGRTRAKIIGDVFATEGVIRPTSAKAQKFSRANGLAQMYNLLADRHELLHGWNPDKEGRYIVSGWFISDRCENLLNAIPWAIADKDKPGDIQAEGDHPFLDVLDGSRYFIFSNAVAGEKPPSEIHREKMALITQTGGITPTRSMVLFADHFKRVQEAKHGKNTETDASRWARQRHPRLGGGARKDDRGLL